MTTSSTAPLRWQDPSVVEFRHDSAFEQSRCAVRSLSRGGKGVVVSMAQPCWRLGLAVGQMGLPSVVENIGDVGSGSRLAPGQWHHRRAPLTLRYRPRSAAERAELLGGDSDAAVPLAAELLVADGVSRLSVQGITFMHSSWDAPRSDDGYLERYGGVRFLNCTSAAAEETRLQRLGMCRGLLRRRGAGRLRAAHGGGGRQHTRRYRR